MCLHHVSSSFVVFFFFFIFCSLDGRRSLLLLPPPPLLLPPPSSSATTLYDERRTKHLFSHLIAVAFKRSVFFCFVSSFPLFAAHFFSSLHYSFTVSGSVCSQSISFFFHFKYIYKKKLCCTVSLHFIQSIFVGDLLSAVHLLPRCVDQPREIYFTSFCAACVRECVIIFILFRWFLALEFWNQMKIVWEIPVSFFLCIY